MIYYKFIDYTGAVLGVIWFMFFINILIYESIKIITGHDNNVLSWLCEEDKVGRVLLLVILFPIFVAASMLWPVTWLLCLFFILTYSVKYFYKKKDGKP